MKKIFATIGIFFLVIIIVLNISFTAYIGPREIVTIYFTNLVYIFDILLLGIFIFAIANIINKFLYNNDKRKKLRMILFILFAVIYIAATIVFTLVVKPPITSDQKVVGLMAYSFNMENSEEMLEKEAYAKISIKEYMQEYGNENNNISDKEINLLVENFEKINKIGIPLTNFSLTMGVILKIIILSILALF